MKVKQVTVVAPTKSRMLPKLGIVSAMNNRTRTAEERKTQRFQLKSVGRIADETSMDGKLREFDSTKGGRGFKKIRDG